MTKINRMVFNGFKSFAKRTELVFGNNFNVVLGPNGSGKSNLIDGICFVLGRISSKSMRAEKLSYLIYNGGKTKKPANKAEVSIFFDNSSNIFPIAESIVKITRMVNQKGQSVYRINDERRTRMQVIETMSAAKINPDGYNIILQGDIIRFVEMSPEERREMIEDIAGIGIYEEKKKKALSELEKVEGRLKEAEILLAERKAYLRELKQDRDQALKYKEVHDKIKQSKATLLYLQIKRKNEQKAEIDGSAGEVREQIEKLQQEISSTKREIQEKKGEIKNIAEEIDRKGEREQVELHKSVEDLKVEIATKKNRITSCDAELQKIRQRKEQLQKDSEDMELRINELKAEKQDMEKQKKEKIREETGLLRSVEKLRQQNKVDDLADIELKIEEIDKETDKRQGELQQMVEQKQNLLREKDKLEVHIQNADDSIKKVKELEKESKAELESLNAGRNEFKNCVLELNKILNEDSGLAARLGEAKRNLARKEEEIARINAKKITIRERDSANNAVQAVLALKGKIDGIYDKVSELGSVNSQYAQALEVAAGPRINSIVVQNDEVAAECIKHLKKNKLGIATFLPLNKLKSETEKTDLKEGKGVHGLAVDLVSYEPKFKKVFQYVFGNTLVVDSIDVSRRLGIGKHRMVSLDGDLAELSGAMHGGYRAKKPETGFMQQELTKELIDCEKQAAELQTLIAGIEARRKECEQRISELKNRKAELEAAMIKSEKMLHLEASSGEEAERVKGEFSKSIAKTGNELAELQLKIAEKSKEVALLKNNRQELRDKIGKLRSPALLAELNAFEQKRKELRDEILRMESEIKNSDTRINEIFAQEKEKIGKIIQQLGKEETEFENEKEGLKKLISERSVNLRETEEKAAEFYAQYKALFSKKDKTSEELQRAEERAIRKEEQIRVLEIRVNNSSIKTAEIAGELAALEEEFRQYADVQLLQNAAEETLKAEVSKFERSLALMGNVNLKALEIYDEVERQYNSLLQKKESLEGEKNDVMSMINEVELKKKDLFMETFSKVNQNFQKVFESISTKGAAYLMIENEQNPFEAGVRIKVRITGEKYLDIRGLSGGEKTLTALSLIFAIQEFEPASFYVLDEVDAALDKKNSEKLAQLIKKYSENAQYVVISHNDTVVSEADILYGVSMDEHGMSNMIGIKTEKIESAS